MGYFQSFGVFSSSVLWAGVLILLNDIYVGFVSCHSCDSEIPVSQKILFMLLWSWCSWRWKCDVWGRVELNSQSAITMTYFRFETKSHPTYTHSLPSCPHI